MIDIQRGAQVYGRQGRYLGVVEAAGTDLLRVRADEPFRRVYYIPTSAVIGWLPGGREIFLGCTCEELVVKGWMHAPQRTSEGPDRPVAQ